MCYLLLFVVRRASPNVSPRPDRKRRMMLDYLAESFERIPIRKF